MRRLLGALIIIATIATVACGKSEAEKQAEQMAADTKKAAEAVKEAAKTAQADGGAEMAKAMQGMANALSGKGPDGKPVELASTDTLKGALPKMSGWEMGELKGERMTSPLPFAQAETEYKKGDTEVQVKVIDTGFSQMLIAPWTMMMASGFSRETEDGYEKATTVAGNPGFEKWTKTDGRGELNMLVNKRFMVSIEGDHLDNIKALHTFAEKIDLGKLPATK
ncbi:MAG: hypothetical protein ABI665_20585 [Vicinamibacterales bacterium]